MSSTETTIRSYQGSYRKNNDMRRGFPVSSFINNMNMSGTGIMIDRMVHIFHRIILIIIIVVVGVSFQIAIDDFAHL